MSGSAPRHRVFVYGTLRSGAVQSVRMHSATRIGGGFVRGRLYRVDWYPAVVLVSAGRVMGEVFEVDEQQLAALDAYEGDEYRRVLVEVEGEAAGTAWIWEWDRAVDGLEFLGSGDWLGAVKSS